MQVLLNGQKYEVKEGTTVDELVDGRRHVAVALNETVVPREQWERPLKEHDRVELVAPFQGG